MKRVEYAYTFQPLVSVQKSLKAAQECNRLLVFNITFIEGTASMARFLGNLDTL